MKYLIKGELELKIGDDILFPCLCDLHIGAVLTDESMSLLNNPTGFLPSPQQILPTISNLLDG